MNVLQIVPELNAGGVERTTLEIVEALTAAGHTAHVASGGGRLEADIRALGGHLHIFNIGSKNPLRLRANAKKLIDIIKAEKIDIVHARSRAPAWPAHSAARATGRPFVTTYHGIYNARTRLKRRYNAVMASGDIVIANSGYTKQHIIGEHGTPDARIVVIPRGVDMALFDPARATPESVEALRESWRVPPAFKLILLPGRLTRWKGQLIAIEALKHLSADTALVCLGDAQGRHDYVEEMWELAERLGVDERLFCPGHSADMATAYMSADVVISASIEPEAFGRVMAEAQAMGRPVIASAHGGALETVEDGKTGYLVPPGQAEALAKAIQHCLDGPGFSADSARERIAEKFSKAQLQQRVLDVYARLLL